MKLPLHIFEPRYKEMIGRCLQEKIPFGMLLATTNSAAKIGCTAEIVQKIRDYADGRMDILTEGRSVFRLLEVFDEKSYYEGLAEFVMDEQAPLKPDKEEQLLAAFHQCHMLLFGQPWSDPRAADTGILSYRMAALLPMELPERQQLLETRSEGERRDRVLEWLNSFLPKLTEREQARKRAGGNGHALN